MRKMIHVGTAAHDVLQALAHETGQTFQDLIDEAVTDLLKKHKRPITLKQMLTQSLADESKPISAKSSKGKGRRRA
jgi:hypothetical protein